MSHLRAVFNGPRQHPLLPHLKNLFCDLVIESVAPYDERDFVDLSPPQIVDYLRVRKQSALNHLREFIFGPAIALLKEAKNKASSAPGETNRLIDEAIATMTVIEMPSECPPVVDGRHITD